jgi:hypothetical protein
MSSDRRLIWMFREDLYHHRSGKNREFETCVCGVYRKISGPKRNGTWDTVYDRFEVAGFCSVTPSVISQTFADVFGGFSPVTFLLCALTYQRGPPPPPLD